MGKVRYLIVCAALLLSLGASGQSDSVALGNMTKVQLAKVYLEEVKRVTDAMAVICFDSVAANVPQSRYTNAKFRAVARKVASYNETLMEEFMEIIPYADRVELLEAILYLKGL